MTKTQDMLLTAASVDIQAGEAKQPTRVQINAYSGGLIRVAGFGLIAIDLAGLQASGERIPILTDHNAALDGILGHGVPETKDGKLLVSGEIVASGESAQRVLELARSGFQFQASVGALPLAERTLSAGESVQINGRTITVPKGGATLITQARLKEVSILSLAADDSTSVHIAANNPRSSSMLKTNVDAESILKEERERIAEIHSAVGDLNEFGGMKHRARKLRDDAIAAKITMDQLNDGLVFLIRASLPEVPAISSRPHVSTDKMIAAALFCRLGLESLGEKHLGATAMEAGKRIGGLHLLDVCREALIAEGIQPPSSKHDLVKAALSTISLPTALGDVANKVLLDAYNESPSTWRSFAAVRQVSDFKTNTGVRPSLLGQLEPVPPGGELKHGSMSEALFPFKIDTFGKMLSIDRRDLINDDLGLFLDTSRALGQTAQRKLSDLVFQILLGNAGGYFSVANGNLLTGADSALTVDGLSKAITLMAAQRDAQGNDLDIKPVTLTVPPELAVTAQTILKSELVQRNAGEGTANVLKNIVNLQIEPRLSNTVKFGNQASKKAWFLFAAPFASPMLVAFLNGQETPTTEFFGLDSDPNRLAASWRVYHDFGAALGDPKAAVKSNGQ